MPPLNAKPTASQIEATRTELLWLENSYHVTTSDYDKDVIAAEAQRFIASLL